MMATFPMIPFLLALHILSVVLWIGGVAFVTTVFLPALVRLDEAERIPVFLDIEGRFGAQARVLVLVAGATGGALIGLLHLQGLLALRAGWWLDAMIALWALFFVLLFILEPFVLHRRLEARGARDGEGTRRLLLRGHRILLALAILVVWGAVWGAQGGNAYL